MNRFKFRFLIRLLPRISILARCDAKSHVSKNAVVYRFTRLLRSEIGDFTYIAPSAELYFTKVGKFCSIGKGVHIGFASHPIDRISTSPVFYSKSNAVRTSFVDTVTYDEYRRTEIGNDVWIGAGAFVMQGVTIGDGSIVAAHAVVTRDVLPYSIIGGVPAKLIRPRFPAEIVNSLQSLAWWNRDVAWIRAKAGIFSRPLTADSLQHLID